MEFQTRTTQPSKTLLVALEPAPHVVRLARIHGAPRSRRLVVLGALVGLGTLSFSANLADMLAPPDRDEGAFMAMAQLLPGGEVTRPIHPIRPPFNSSTRCSLPTITWWPRTAPTA